MIYTEQTKQAMKLAYDMHHGQTDRSGLPYIHHVLHVAEQMPDEITTVAALLHDIVEDTTLTLDELYAKGFPPEVVEAVRCLTRDPNMSYVDYIDALHDNPIAVNVKLADLEHNRDLTRLKRVSQKDILRARKYQAAINFLQMRSK